MGLSTLRGHLGRNRGAMMREVFGKNNLMIVNTIEARTEWLRKPTYSVSA